MERNEIRNALSNMELINVLDLYFEARTGLHCFSDEFLPVHLLCELYRIEISLHQCCGASMLRTIPHNNDTNQND